MNPTGVLKNALTWDKQQSVLFAVRPVGNHSTFHVVQNYLLVVFLSLPLADMVTSESSPGSRRRTLLRSLQLPVTSSLFVVGFLGFFPLMSELPLSKYSIHLSHE